VKTIAFRLCVIAIVWAACGCGDAASQVKPGDVRSGIAQVRQLGFLQAVPFVSKTPDEAQQMMIAKLERDNTDEELRVSGEAGQMTGLFPSGIDLKREQIKLMREQVAGFYDPHDKVMVEVRGMGVLGGAFVDHSGAGGELLYAHELTHALQDQHFGLEPMMERAKNNDDEEIALHSVMEGDATLAGLGYVAGGLTSQAADRIVAQLGALDAGAEAESDGAPLALRAPMMFQYSAGARFVAEAWKRGGWSAVDALYRDPPLSSQQIIEPSLYFDHRTLPRKVVLSGYQSQLANWKKVEDDTFGELLLKIILERNLPPHAPALSLAQGWAGDQMVILQKDGDARRSESTSGAEQVSLRAASGTRVTLIWMIAFRDAASARAFAATYDTILVHPKGPRYAHAVEARADAVLILIGPAVADFAALAPRIWQATTIATPGPATQPSEIAGGAPAAGRLIGARR
ncbi:MAG: hypothetical protein ACREQD_11110, partial [Candidatus Binataceae bacterium]